MTIVSAAAAAVPSQHAMTPIGPSANSGGTDGATFAEQLSGLTVVRPGAGAWRSAGAAKTAKKPEGEKLAAAPAAVAVSPLALPETTLLAQLSGGSLTLGQALTPVDDQPPTESKNPGEAAPDTVPVPQAIETLPPAAVAVVNPVNNDTPVPVSSSKPAGNPEALAQPKVTAAVGSAQQPQELAFATRVQPVQGMAHGELPASMASNASVASASKKVTGPTADAPALTAAPAVAAVEHRPEISSHAAPPAVSDVRPTEAPSPAESVPKAVTPLKDISLQVTQPGRERVDVRVVQQGGEVHVTVHSSDASLNSGLRQGLSELQGRLEENGYRSEMWKPAADASPLAPTAASHTASNDPRGSDSQPQHGGPQQEDGRRHQNQSNQPRWVEELESSLTGKEQSSGGFHGIGN